MVVVTVVTVEGTDDPLLDELDEPELDAPFRLDEEPLLELLVLELDPPKDVELEPVLLPDAPKLEALDPVLPILPEPPKLEPLVPPVLILLDPVLALVFDPMLVVAPPKPVFAEEELPVLVLLIVPKLVMVPDPNPVEEPILPPLNPFDVVAILPMDSVVEV